MRHFDINNIHERVQLQAEARHRRFSRESQLADLAALGRDFLAAFPQAEEDYNYIVSQITSQEIVGEYPEVLEDYTSAAKGYLTAAEEAWAELCTVSVYKGVEGIPTPLIYEQSGLTAESFKGQVDQGTRNGYKWQVINPDFHAPDDPDHAFIGETPVVKLDQDEIKAYVNERMETIMRCLDFLQVSVEEIRIALPGRRSEF